MKRAILLSLLAAALASVTWGAERISHPTLRKTLAVAACAASAFDAGTTFAASHNPNLRESNGLFAGPNGHPRIWTLSLVKGGTCAASLYFAWHPRRGAMGDVSMYGSAGTAAVLSYVGFHNLQLLRGSK